MVKRIAMVLLILQLITALAVPAWAADGEAEQAADTLCSLGLFRGTGTDQNGNPRFELERTAVREEALVMLIRLLGKEREALSCTAVQPFTDVSQWADRYVAYAYQQGLTNGIGGGRFGSGLEATGNMYLTFVLRALGYQDSGPEAAYSYGTAASFAAQIGVTDHEYKDEGFLRGDIAQVSLSALSFPLYGSDQTLIQSLVNAGAVTADSAQAAGFPVNGGAGLLGQQVSIAAVKQEFGTVILDAAQVKRAFPTARQFYRSNYWQEIEEQVMEVAKTPSTNLEELLVLESMLDDRFGGIPLEPLTDSALYFNAVDEEDFRPLLLLLDHSDNVVGMCSSYDGGDTVVFTRTNIQAGSLLEEFLAQVDACLARKDQLEVVIDTDDPQGGWDDGTGMAYHYPVYINGKELDEQYCLVTDVNYQVFLEMIQRKGGNFDTYLERMMAYLLLGGNTKVIEEDGKKHTYGELSDEWQSRYAYDEHWDRYGNLVSARYGYYTGEHRSRPEFVGVCDKSGNLLGYTILEATE